MLYAYELSLERERENIPFEVQKVVDNEDDRFIIEHVWPQTVSDELPEHLHETINENSDRLGNLALMIIEDNAGNQNDPFEKKKAAFDESKFRMLNEIFENDEWTLDHIEDRETRILNVIKSRWPDTVAQEADSAVPTAEDD
ncbi:HNH endonuclease family protein [Halodesulfurarchaeum formicicum]|uniref:HNH endonuclease family protein n=1 Tax=Halodesulfurarchaeum formicicum TaxID=1873524 RepID=UPI001E379940